jgi:transcriptional regulator with XRE-family HTH domain
MGFHETVPDSPGGRIRTTRQAHGTSLRQLERKDPRTFEKGRWSRIERGLHGLSVDDLHAFAVALGLRDLAKALRPFAEGRRD